MKNHNKEEIKIDSSKKMTLDVKDLMVLKPDEQDKKLDEILNFMYDNKIQVNKKYKEKILDLCFDSDDNEIYLPKSLKVEKIGSKVYFSFKKHNNLWIFILCILSFIFVAASATYAGAHLITIKKFNIDLNGDGIPDFNLDLDGDGTCDVNCPYDRNGKKPSLNIDYKGNQKPVFNVPQKDGTINNQINIDTDGDGKCDINCDINGDGWPDLNIDMSGDGKVELDIDKDGDGVKDSNLDTSGDGVCDINCDLDGDGFCDHNCIESNPKEDGNGEEAEKGDGDIDFESASLVINFASLNRVNVTNLYPDDQKGEGVNTKVPDMLFTIENMTDNVLYYNIKWLVKLNNFKSTNFWYKFKGDKGGFNCDWKTTPFKDDFVATHVRIEPKTVQNYAVSFTLHGIGAEQNFDQGKVFDGRIEVKIED